METPVNNSMLNTNQGKIKTNFRMLLIILIFISIFLTTFAICATCYHHGWHYPTDVEIVLASLSLVLFTIERCLTWWEKAKARKRWDELIPLVAEEKKKPEITKRPFYVLEGKTFTWDRFFKVFVDERGMHGAYLIGQIYDEASAAVFAHATQEAEAIASPIVNNIVARRYQREAEYKSHLPGGTEFLAKDPKNFSYSKQEITRITYDPRRSLRTEAVTNQGTLLVYTSRGRRKFVITGEQEVVLILAVLEHYLTAVEYV